MLSGAYEVFMLDKDEDDYCLFLNRLAKNLDEMLERWESIDKDDLKARVQLFKTVLENQIAHHCSRERPK